MEANYRLGNPNDFKNLLPLVRDKLTRRLLIAIFRNFDFKYTTVDLVWQIEGALECQV